MIPKLAQSTQPAGKGAGTQPRFSGSRAQAPSILVVQFCPPPPPGTPLQQDPGPWGPQTSPARSPGQVGYASSGPNYQWLGVRDKRTVCLAREMCRPLRPSTLS